MSVTLPTLSEALAAVDSWGPDHQWGLHEIARVLAAEVRRLRKARRLSRDVAREAIQEALTDWWDTRNPGEEPLADLVDEIMGAVTLAVIIEVAKETRTP